MILLEKILKSKQQASLIDYVFNITRNLFFYSTCMDLSKSIMFAFEESCTEFKKPESIYILVRIPPPLPF